MSRGHTPYGYRIENGAAVIHEEEAAQIRKMYEGYLGGLSLVASAAEAGITMKHSSAKRMMQNSHLLGDDFYPAIIDKETRKKIITESERRAAFLGRNFAPKEKKVIPPPTRFTLTKTDIRYTDPYKQAQYIYSQIKEVETDG